VSRPDRVPAYGRVLGVWLALSVAILASAWPHMETLGLYYDEAFLAQQARDFVEPERASSHPASVRSLTVFGRPFPLRNAAYLGSLKSQLLIPVLSVAGTSPRVVRATTLATGLVALLLAMLWAQRCFGTAIALAMGLLVASDPSFYFFSQFEWGPFTTNLLCRSGGLLLAVVAWQSPRPRLSLLPAAGAGALFGLGVFSRVDFVVILGALGAGLALARPELLRSALGDRRPRTAAFAAGLVLAAAPMLLSAVQVLATSSQIADRGDVAEKARVLWSVLDGSHFHRLLQVGGLFERVFEVEAPATPFGIVVVACALWLAWDAVRRWRRAGRGGLDPAGVFLLATSAILTAGMLAMPGAVRAHHQLNALPFLQLLVASVGVGALTRGGAARAVAVGALAALLLCNLLVIQRTQALMEATGGRGRFSHALDDFARSVDAEPDTSVVSLDWGFHEPLQLLTRRARLSEPIWEIPASLQRGVAWRHEADGRTLYLVHDAPYDLFGLGPDFLARARELPDEAVEIEAHRDREGEVAFYSVRITRPHLIVHGGRFQIRTR